MVSIKTAHALYRDNVRYLHMSCWRIRKRTSERSERVSFLVQKQRVRKYRTKHFPCCNLFISYLLRFSPSKLYLLFHLANNKLSQVMSLFIMCKHFTHCFFESLNIFTSSSVRASAAFGFFFLCLVFLSCFLRASRNFLAWWTWTNRQTFVLDNREFKNKRFNEQNNGCARAL